MRDVSGVDWALRAAEEFGGKGASPRVEDILFCY